MNTPTRHQETEPAPLPRLHPKIHLTRCEYCNGTGRSLVRYMGRVTESTCSQCVGRGTIVCESA